MNKKEIAVFGLSANPPTGDEGHLGIVRFLRDMKRFDEIWILPVYAHQFGKKLETFEDRINMCRESMEPLSCPDCNVVVLPLEKIVNERMGGSHGTVDTLEHIKRENPSINLHLILGGDTFNDVAAGKWKNGDRYSDSCHFSSLDPLPHVCSSDSRISPNSTSSKEQVSQCPI